MLNVKCPKKLILCLGIAAVFIDGTSIVEKKSIIFDYSRQKLVSDMEFDDIIAKEIHRVKSLKRFCKPWIQKIHESSTVYKLDLLSVLKKHDKQKILKGIGLKSIEKLISNNIRTIVDVLEHRGNEECETLLKMNKLLNLLTLKKTRIDRINHQDADNPYASLHGESWLAEIKKSTKVKKFDPISDMVKHIYNKSRRLMEGTKYSDNWFFYHNDLSYDI